MAKSNDEFWEGVFATVADRPRIVFCDAPARPNVLVDDLPEGPRQFYLAIVHAWSVQKWRACPGLRMEMTLEKFEDDVVDLMAKGAMKVLVSPADGMACVGLWAGDGYVRI